MADIISRDGLTRRPSFRRSLAEAGLPPEYLDSLEQKRKTLDDSIHKYVASKEREYKQYEKELRQRVKLAQAEGAQPRDARPSRSPTESAAPTDSAPLFAVDTLLHKGATTEHDRQGGPNGSQVDGRQKSSDPTDCREGSRQEPDFDGLFTPEYLAALRSTKKDSPERTSSEPPIATANDSHVTTDAQRTNLDPAAQVLSNRSPRLQLLQRMSSSGSSVDGKLVSALKSTTELSKPTTKRVSLALGDSIVAPSDNVPPSLSANSSSSHSRSRPSGRGHVTPDAKGKSLLGEPDELQVVLPMPDGAEADGPQNGAPVSSANAPRKQEASAPTSSTRQAQQSRPSRDADDDLGELWHLEESDTAEFAPESEQDHGIELDDDPGNEITGRLGNSFRPENPSELASEADTIEPDEPSPDSGEESESAVHLDFNPAATLPQQPAHPGFRRPSVNADPMYTGRDYVRAERDAEEDVIYGSSYSRPSSKGSFTSGSLGESYMARHAEEMMKTRTPQQQQQPPRRLPSRVSQAQ